MKRRPLLFGGCALALARGARAQPGGRPRRLGFMRWSAAAPDTQESVRRALGELGYLEEKHISIAWHWVTSTEQAERSSLELVRDGAELIIVSDTPVAHAALKATRTVPIVLGGVADPVGSGLVSNLARPGGNVTGFSWNLPALAGKELELLKEALPPATRFAFLGSAQDPATRLFVENTRDAGTRLGVQAEPVLVRGPDEFAGAFDAMLREKVQGVVIQPLFAPVYQALAGLALRNRLASISAFRSFPDSGGMLAYGPSARARWQRTAVYVDRILRGARPGDLPIEDPRTFDMVINLKTARSLGLTIPQSLLLRADEVIQ